MEGVEGPKGAKGLKGERGFTDGVGRKGTKGELGDAGPPGLPGKLLLLTRYCLSLHKSEVKVHIELRVSSARCLNRTIFMSLGSPIIPYRLNSILDSSFFFTLSR